MERPPPDAGESLIEILVSVTILGIAIVALMSGMGTAALTSGLHARQAVGSTSVRAAAEALQGSGIPYAPCATSYTLAGYAGPAPTVQVLRYWRAGTWQSGCGAPADDHGAQEVHLTIPSGDTRVRDESLVVVKRKPCGTGDPLC